MTEKTKKKRAPIVMSPPGRAIWPDLIEPATKFAKDNEPFGYYKVGLVLKKTDPGVPAFMALLEDTRQQGIREYADTLMSAGAKKRGQAPKEAQFGWKDEEEKDTGELTGNVIVNFRMSAGGHRKSDGKVWRQAPDLFDAKLKRIDPANTMIGGGSLIRVGFELSPFASDLGGGVSLRLRAVQVLELVERGTRDASAYGFEAADGYEYSPPAAAAEQVDESTVEAAGASNDTDDI